MTSDFLVPLPEKSIGLQFWKLHVKWQRLIIDALTPFQITHTQFVILACIKWFETQGTEPSQVQLSQLTSIEKMTLSKAIRQLETRKLVTRSKSKVDARSVLINLTGEANRIIPLAIRAVEEVDAMVFGNLTEQEQKTLIFILQKASLQ